MLYNTDVGKAKEGGIPLGILSDILSGDVNALINLLYQIPVILIALTLHEVAHGYVAYKCGDPTAKMLGRLSLNPLHHLDPIGTLAMVLMGFGWAKPVPVNSRNFKHFRRDDILVSVAGITVNFCLFLFSSFLIVLVQQFIFTPEFYHAIYFGALPPEILSELPALPQIELLSMKGNFTGLTMANDAMTLLSEYGLTEYVKTPWLMYVQRFLMYFSLTNLGLALFNLLPIPPLDGYHLFNDILFRGKLRIPAKVVQGISLAFVAVLLLTDYVSIGLGYVRNFIQDGVIRGILWIFGVQ